MRFLDVGDHPLHDDVGGEGRAGDLDDVHGEAGLLPAEELPDQAFLQFLDSGAGAADDDARLGAVDRDDEVVAAAVDLDAVDHGFLELLAEPPAHLDVLAGPTPCSSCG